MKRRVGTFVCLFFNLLCFLPGSVVVTVEEGSDAMLPCSINTKENIEKLTFDWKKGGLEVFFYQNGKHYNNGGRTGQDKQFQGRVFHFEDELKHGNASIKISRTQLTDSGNYACTFPPNRSPSSVTLHVAHGDPLPTVEWKDTSEPSVTTLKTDDGTVLQCVVKGASPKPKVEWKDSSGNILPVKDLKETERGDSYDIVLQAALTKTDRYHCVVTQEEIDHQIYAEIYANISGEILIFQWFKICIFLKVQHDKQLPRTLFINCSRVGSSQDEFELQIQRSVLSCSETEMRTTDEV
uniref:Ig-like domain-containing protein n=1 Tax=Sparus aurata TaxID=8175 RepID=A0A671WFB8_SPAAU